ncbi:MAG: Maf family protein [Pseudobdellovibrio sp.]
MNRLILASTSIYRAELLHKTGLIFEVLKPNFDEDSAKEDLLKNKTSALLLAENLSKGKARSLAAKNLTVIAGDQLVHFNQQILGKAATFEKAFKQLKNLSGESHQLITSVTIIANQLEFHLNHVTDLVMKKLTDSEIEHYLKKDEPYDCAGSYKIEKSGIILFDEIRTDDFTAIQGLPMIWISKRLKELGYEFFKN